MGPSPPWLLYEICHRRLTFALSHLHRRPTVGIVRELEERAWGTRVASLGEDYGKGRAATADGDSRLLQRPLHALMSVVDLAGGIRPPIADIARFASTRPVSSPRAGAPLA